VRDARIGVIGHVEWVTFARGDPPPPGEIATLGEPFTLPAGGGAVSAVQLARMGAAVVFFTALGADQAARTCRRFLDRAGVEVRAARRQAPQTPALTILQASGERTIMVIGDNLQPAIDDDLGWRDLERLDAVYFTGEDPATLRAARRAPILVVTARRLAALAASGVRADAVVGSARDQGESIPIGGLARPPALWVQTAGAAGGSWRATVSGAQGAWPAAPPPGPLIDAYGAGDCFIAGFTLGLARGAGVDEAVAGGADAGAACVTRMGPYGE
jgi:ribokinase